MPSAGFDSLPLSMAMNLSTLGEFGLISHLARMTPSRGGGVVLGIGDDAAVVKGPKGMNLLLAACDTVIEKIHFEKGASGKEIGWKAMARNISDIAAMGGLPRYALVAATLPRSLLKGRALAIHQGILKAAKDFGIMVVGGDTSHHSGGIHLTVTILGEVHPRHLLTRSGARPGDVVCVTGSLGGSIYGKHLAFTPRMEEARFLARSRFKPTSMIDLSDGLASDLMRLAEQSGVGFEVHAESIPISTEIARRHQRFDDRVRHALADGEDYELLFTVKPGDFSQLQKSWKRRFKLPVTMIGRVRPRSFGLKLLSDGRTKAIKSRTNDHFLD
jgi:thiamine-monophosphate kinase